MYDIYDGGSVCNYKSTNDDALIQKFSHFTTDFEAAVEPPAYCKVVGVRDEQNGTFVFSYRRGYGCIGRLSALDSA